MVKFFKKYLVTIIIFVAIFLFYYLMTESGIANPFLFPKISEIVKIYEQDPTLMFKNMLSSFTVLFPSMGLAFLIALFLGTVLGLNKTLREKLHPVVYAFSVIPSILLAPFALLIAPTFYSASMFLIIYSVVWSILFSTITGIMTIDKRYLDKAKALELTGLKRLIKVILPAASPSILAGFTNSLRNSFIMLVYAEIYGKDYGMGYYVKKYADFGNYPQVWAGFLFMVVVLVIVMQFFEKLKSFLLKWTTNN